MTRMTPTFAVMARPDDIEDTLVARLRAAGYRAGRWHRDVLRVDVVQYLVTDYPTPAEAFDEVRAALPMLAHHATWVQCGDVPLAVAGEFAGLAASTGKHYLHVPLTDATVTAYALPADPRADVVQALAGPAPIRWAGPLEDHVTPGADWLHFRYRHPDRCAAFPKETA